MQPAMLNRIRVVARIKPTAKSVDDCAADSCVTYDSNSISISRTKLGKRDVHSFTFDNVYSPFITQDEVYADTRELIDAALNGYNATVFAFGMTGSGKSFTIAGNREAPGIVPRAVHHVFNHLRSAAVACRNSAAMVFLTYVELYNNNLYDLLEGHDGGPVTSANLKLHEHPSKGVSITGSATIRTPVSSAEEMLALISSGNRMRSTAATNLNDRSSRSHTIITIEIVMQVASGRSGSEGISTDHDDRHEQQLSTKVGKLHLVDLAGSERVKVSGAEGQVLEEAKQINKALSVLGDVLNSLSKSSSETASHQEEDDAVVVKPRSPKSNNVPHIPYRNSKLTMLLKDSLGGNAMTMMIATLCQANPFYQQTLMTLRYASRAKLIRLRPTQNIRLSDSSEAKALLEATKEVARMKELLSQRTEEFRVIKARLQLLESESAKRVDQLISDEGSLEKEKLTMIKRMEELQSQSAGERADLQEKLKLIIRNHESELAQRERDYVLLEAQLSKQMTEIEILHNDSSQSKQSLSELEIELSRIKVENARLKQELTIARDNVAECSMSSKDREQFILALHKLTQSRAKYKRLADDLISCQQNDVDKDKRISELQSQLLLASDAKIESDRNLAALKIEVEQYLGTIETLEREKDDVVAKSSSQIEATDRRCTRIETDLTKEVSRLNEAAASSRHVIEGLHLQIDESASEYRTLSQRYDCMLAEYDGNRRQLDDLRSTLMEYEETMQIITTQRSAEQQALLSQCTELQAKYEDLQFEHNQMGQCTQDQVSLARSEIEILQLMTKEKDESMKSMSLRITDLNAAIQKLTVENKDLKYAATLQTSAELARHEQAVSQYESLLKKQSLDYEQYISTLESSVSLLQEQLNAFRLATKIGESDENNPRNLNINVNTVTTANGPQTLAQSPKADHRFLREKINSLVSHERELFLTLEQRLKDLHDARARLLKVNGVLVKVHNDTDEQLSKSDVQLSASAKQVLEYERKLRDLAFENRRLSNANSDLEARLAYKSNILALEEQQSAMLREQLQRERQEKADVIQKAVQIVSQYSESDMCNALGANIGSTCNGHDLGLLIGFEDEGLDASTKYPL